mgnify:FL=1
MTERGGKTLAGVARAAVRADAVIIDSGIASGIEKFCLRKHLTLIGVAPENQIIYPRINPAGRKVNELTNGHTHFVLIGDPKEDDENKQDASQTKKRQKTFEWSEEAGVKIELAKRIAAGRTKKNGLPACKVVMVMVGDMAICYKEVLQAIAMKIPVVVLAGSVLSNKCMNFSEQQPEEMPEEKRKKLTQT